MPDSQQKVQFRNKLKQLSEEAQKMQRFIDVGKFLRIKSMTKMDSGYEFIQKGE